VLWRRWRRQHRCVGRGVWKYIDIGVGWDDDRPVDRKCKAGNKIISPRTKQGAS
jgi:hypothetical protein